MLMFHSYLLEAFYGYSDGTYFISPILPGCHEDIMMMALL